MLEITIHVTEEQRKIIEAMVNEEIKAIDNQITYEREHPDEIEIPHTQELLAALQTMVELKHTLDLAQIQ